MATQPTGSPAESSGGEGNASDEQAMDPGMRRVQVIERWNSWVRVYDPEDETLTWVDLSQQPHLPA